jgi:alpha-galactosidase
VVAGHQRGASSGAVTAQAALEPTHVVAPDGAVVTWSWGAAGLTWSVANDRDDPLPVDRVQVHLRLDLPAGAEVHAFLHGWQSWSASGDAVVGEHVDPALDERAPGLLRAMHHADAAPPPAGEARSELVTAVTAGDASVCLGFDGGARHDGSFRLRADGSIVVEAFLGGAVLAPGEERALHDVAVVADLDAWAAWAGARSQARVAAPYQVGWCSWYQYFHDVTEADVRANLTAAGDWPFDVFQVDDGYQRAIGDWLLRAPSFPTRLEDLAADVAAAGFVPGLWLAPFLASPSSDVVARHPDWVVRRRSGRPMVGMVTPEWGGEQWVLDVTHPEVAAHLEELARTLVAMGWRYLKLDFTYAPSFDGAWHDPRLTPAERVRAGYDAVRRGAGDDTFLLGCGAPLGPCIGVVDGMRIGPDVAPRWEPAPSPVGYDATTPSTRNALHATEARAFQHRRLWLSDPDCLMLRTTGTDLTEAQVATWAAAVAESGGMAIVSDDLAVLDSDARRRLDEVITVGRAVDSARQNAVRATS